MGTGRVLICGGKKIEGTQLVIGRGFEGLGLAVTYLPTRDYTRASKSAGYSAIEGIAEKIGAIIEAERIQCVIWVMCKEDCEPGLVAGLKQKYPDTVFCFHSFDDPYEVDAGGYRRSAEFDCAITCCVGSIPDYAALGVPAICLYPPCDPEIHGAAKPDPALACDISLIATNLYPRSAYPQVLFERSELAEAVDGLGTVHLYGPWDKRFGWGGPHGRPGFERNWRGTLRYEQLPAAFASSRINLNTHVRPDGYLYLNERFTTVLGTGGFMVCDAVYGIEQFNDKTKRFEIFTSRDHLLEICKFYLAHESAREKVALAGRRFAASTFSGKAFAEALVAFVDGGFVVRKPPYEDLERYERRHGALYRAYSRATREASPTATGDVAVAAPVVNGRAERVVQRVLDTVDMKQGSALDNAISIATAIGDVRTPMFEELRTRVMGVAVQKLIGRMREFDVREQLVVTARGAWIAQDGAMIRCDQDARPLGRNGAPASSARRTAELLDQAGLGPGTVVEWGSADGAFALWFATTYRTSRVVAVAKSADHAAALRDTAMLPGHRLPNLEVEAVPPGGDDAAGAVLALFDKLGLREIDVLRVTAEGAAQWPVAALAPLLPRIGAFVLAGPAALPGPLVEATASAMFSAGAAAVLSSGKRYADLAGFLARPQPAAEGAAARRGEDILFVRTAGKP